MATRAALCIHDLDPVTCSVCRGDDPIERRAVPHARPTTITAHLHGRCAGCGQPIYPGDQIRHSAGEDGWVCEECS